jgi:two-component system cell cycle sensor histidine kinase/response regulator CckA
MIGPQFDGAANFDVRILVVEDERLLAEELRERLESIGATVVGSVVSGEQAIATAEQLRPDLVLMDIRLKGEMDGIEAATRIIRTVGTPIVFLTAHSDHNTVERAKAASPYGYILKPLQEHELRVTLSLALHRCRLERELRASEQRFLTTLSSIGDAVIATDVHGRVTFVNPVAERLTGWSGVDVEGRPVNEVFPIVAEHDRSAITQPALHALASHQVEMLREPVLLLTRDGGAVLVEHSAAPIADGPDVRGAVLVFRDVSERRKQEDAARDTELRLREVHKLEAVSRLAGGVAHDVNNMMTVVTGYADLLLSQLPAGDPNRGLVEELKNAGDRTAGITRQLLSFSRHRIPRPQLASVSELLTGIEGLLAQVLPARVTLRRITLVRRAHIRIDAGQFEQIMLNLVLNARDAMPRGGTITIETSVASLDETWHADDQPLPAGDYVLVTVTDTGAGIAPEIGHRIFEPFFSTKADGHGTGLGLVVVRDMARAAGGHVLFYSEPGHGSSFKLYFPRASALDDDEPSAAAPEIGDEALRADGPRLVLLAEDEDAVRSLTETLLEQHGYTVLAARDGEEALQMAATHDGRIDLLLTDVVMPRVGGRELWQRLCAERHDVRVLFMSGYTADTVLRQGIMRDGLAFLQKPFKGRHLLAAVRDVLN